MQASILSPLAPLMRARFKVCANGCIPNLKFSASLQNQHAAQAICHSGKDAVGWSQDTGLQIRKAASKFRDMAIDDVTLQTTLRKAWVLHKKNRLGNFRTFRCL